MERENFKREEPAKNQLIAPHIITVVVLIQIKELLKQTEQQEFVDMMNA
ncbi:MAG: hypothetical protein Q7R31_00845 [Candidatus Levybacteria bacterium]|nr:hypothetical protein [Candidatus Levybacteria bacterium]